MTRYCRDSSKTLEENFLVIMNPSQQSVCAEMPEKCYYGNSPSLSAMKIAFNREYVIAWIVIQLNAVLEMFGNKDNVPMIIVKECAQDILANYSWLTASELMLCLSRIKVGKYGKIAYGNVTVDDITSKIKEFLKERNSEMEKIERERRNEETERERNEMLERGVSRKEAYRIINAAASGDEHSRMLLGNKPETWKYRMYVIEFTIKDESLIDKITKYFNITENLLTRDLVASFENEKLAKFMEGVSKGFYKIIE